MYCSEILRAHTSSSARRRGKSGKGSRKPSTSSRNDIFPGSPGFGAHAIRHLVATDWLRNNPGDFLTVAKVLNDRIETVIENYAHLSRDDSFIRYEEFLEKRRQPSYPA
jgi:integrase